MSRALAEILAELPADDRRVIAEALAAAEGDRAASRCVRLSERDEAIRRALAAFYGDLKSRPAAVALAADLDKYLATAWPRERDVVDLVGASAHRLSLHRIARLNHGCSISWKQIWNIGQGFRSAKL